MTRPVERSGKTSSLPDALVAVLCWCFNKVMWPSSDETGAEGTSKLNATLAAAILFTMKPLLDYLVLLK